LLHVAGTSIFVLPNNGDWKKFGKFSVTEFYPHISESSSIYSHFRFKISACDEPIIAYLDEDALMKELYCNEEVYKYLGKPACIVIDVAISLGGSEAVAESLYSVADSQRQDGGQHNDTLDMRTIIDWNLPSVLSCPEAIEAIAQIYREGDIKASVAPHRTPILKNFKESKVINRLKDSTENNGLPHFRK